ncbi:hypothetical protein CHLNCDRAFT_145125 [Chlorella variabilis]|uniref:Carbohydrate kinase PfkB domain-containing protein n=1 Tax=Chlorella variabilis TaxID=554065 RepID=E1ZCM7_CHLVA|nr:hypothetical protein CHLNCDRAFT_145125 [Chlorella variabilis]EFN56270.1 hypothetical protein CHLNCDRAFT_145125 [Chlorella variabilis]|eukprot:XP_005848372.1 hypothetical protein CHLNCDRAFT_145125 [Chlorella variabilis]
MSAPTPPPLTVRVWPHTQCTWLVGLAASGALALAAPQQAALPLLLRLAASIGARLALGAPLLASSLYFNNATRELGKAGVLDIVARVDHSLLERLGMEPGGCVPVSAEEMGRLLALPEVHGGMKRVPGGSAANVLKGLASLAPASMSVAFVGMVGQHEAGRDAL